MSTPSRRVAIVTGAGGDLGPFIALQLAEDGLDVVVNDFPQRLTRLEDLVNQIKAKGVRSLAVTANVAIEAEVQSMIEKTVSELGSLDVVRMFKDLKQTRRKIIYNNYRLWQIKRILNLALSLRVIDVWFLFQKRWPDC